MHKKHLNNLKERVNASYDTSKSNKAKPKLYDYIKLDEFSSLANKSSSSGNNGNIISSCSGGVSLDLLPCYAFIQADGFCLRTNNIAIYAEANRQVNK